MMIGTGAEGLTVKQAAQRLDLTPHRIRQLFKEGRLDYQLTPYGRLVDSASLDRLIDERRESEFAHARRIGR